MLEHFYEVTVTTCIRQLKGIEELNKMVSDMKFDRNGKMVFNPKGKLPKGSEVFQQVLDEIASENVPKLDLENENDERTLRVPQSKTKTPRMSGSRWHIARAKMTITHKPMMYKIVIAATKKK